VLQVPALQRPSAVAPPARCTSCPAWGVVTSKRCEQEAASGVHPSLATGASGFSGKHTRDMACFFQPISSRTLPSGQSKQRGMALSGHAQAWAVRRSGRPMATERPWPALGCTSMQAAPTRRQRGSAAQAVRLRSPGWLQHACHTSMRKTKPIRKSVSLQVVMGLERGPCHVVTDVAEQRRIGLIAAAAAAGGHGPERGQHLHGHGVCGARPEGPRGEHAPALHDRGGARRHRPAARASLRDQHVPSGLAANLRLPLMTAGPRRGPPTPGRFGLLGSRARHVSCARRSSASCGCCWRAWRSCAITGCC